MRFLNTLNLMHHKRKIFSDPQSPYSNANVAQRKKNQLLIKRFGSKWKLFSNNMIKMETAKLKLENYQKPIHFPKK